MCREMNAVYTKAATVVEAVFSCANTAALLILDAMIMASIIFALLTLRLYILNLISLLALLISIILLAAFAVYRPKDRIPIFA